MPTLFWKNLSTIATHLRSTLDFQVSKKKMVRKHKRFSSHPSSVLLDAAHQDSKEPVPSSHTFTKIEKNLAYMGFFTPSSKGIKNRKSKTVVFSRTAHGKHLEVRATIIPGAVYGLPVTTDQDKYLAFQKIINDIQKRTGVVQNPVAFSSMDILRLTGVKKNGDSYKEIHEWLYLMDSVQIISEGVVWFAGKKKWAKESLKLFSRVVTFGEELGSGKVADKHYVWLSDWMLENINHNYLLPVDLDTYNQLKTYIAKALVPLLQVRLYASVGKGAFEIRYEKLCQILGVKPCRYFSDIKKQLVPSLNELRSHGYISVWHIEDTKDDRDYKLIFKHGEKFLRDLKLKGTTNPRGHFPEIPDSLDQQPKKLGKEVENELISELTRRGIEAGEAGKLLNHIDQDQNVMRQIEYVDFLVESAPQNRYWNPSGMYVHYIRKNINPPVSFESREQRANRLAEQVEYKDRLANENRVLLAYFYSYKPAEVEKYIGSHQSDFMELVSRKVEEKRVDEHQASREVRKQLSSLAEGNKLVPFLKFEEFRSRYESSEEFRLLYSGPSQDELYP